MRISPKYYKSHWFALDLTSKDSPDWNTAIDILVDRIDGRILKQIKALEMHPDDNIREFSGFAIMALDCLLIETLEQFHRGKSRTGSGMSVKAFHNFFSRHEAFSRFFDTEEKTEIFYSHIRCGILHQAQTKEKSIIHIRPKTPIFKWNSLTNINEGVAINRKLFHKEVLVCFNNYVEKLRASHNLNLRKKFQKKMNSIMV